MHVHTYVQSNVHAGKAKFIKNKKYILRFD